MNTRACRAYTHKVIMCSIHSNAFVKFNYAVRSIMNQIIIKSSHISLIFQSEILNYVHFQLCLPDFSRQSIEEVHAWYVSVMADSLWSSGCLQITSNWLWLYYHTGLQKDVSPTRFLTLLIHPLPQSSLVFW